MALNRWHDTELEAGDRWDKEIRAELKRMDIFLCLVSYQFLASNYIKTVELPRAMARHKNGEIELVPVILYRMDLERDCKLPYELNPLPEWGKPWQDFIKDGDWNHALPLKGTREIRVILSANATVFARQHRRTSFPFTLSRNWWWNVLSGKKLEIK